MSSHLSSTPTPTFGATSTAEEVCHYYSPHIRNKTILITGVTPGGLGLATAKALAAHSPRLLILATRSSSALSAAKTEITSVAPGVQVKLLVLDLSSLKRVREAAAELNGWAEVDKIDILINNAGMQTQEYAKSEDGVEMHFAINHLGPWLFTNLIMAKLGAGSGRQGGEGKGGRIVWVSSMAHLYFQGGWEDVKPEENDRKNWNPDLAYGRSKTANILTALHLARQNIQSFSLHPGFILTNMHAKIPREVLQAKGFYDADWNVTVPLKSLSQGAATIVFAALDDGLIAKNGAYLMDCAVVEGEGALVSEVAKSMEEAETLWKVSEELIGEEFAL